MKIVITDITPEPNLLAGKAKTYVAGPAEEVARRVYEFGDRIAQDEVIDRMRDGYVIVARDEVGYVTSMHLKFQGRLVEMQDGYRTLHAQVLLRELGYSFSE